MNEGAWFYYAIIYYTRTGADIDPVVERIVVVVFRTLHRFMQIVNLFQRQQHHPMHDEAFYSI